MSSLGRIKEFIGRNMLIVVMLPGIGLAQYGWWKLQDNPTFVRPDEKREFPAITVYKHIKASMGYGEHPDKPHQPGSGRR